MAMRRIATATMALIDHTMRADQGASFRQWEKKVLPHLDDAYRGHDDAFRSHMGASTMGNECGRAIWYGFRWATRPLFDGRILRLFNRGHLEEGRCIAMLLMIGAEVFQQDANGKQFRISDYAGHYGGSGDGFVRGIPDLLEGAIAACEFKTHNDKSFIDVKDKGVRDSKFEHYVQMQQYMRKFAVPITLYVAVNKNTDEIYMELVELDTAIADQFIERAGKIIWMHNPPDKMPNASAGWYKCKWCDHRPVCHLGAPADRNCRTCNYSWATDKGDAEWVCGNPARTAMMETVVIDKERQLTGCEHYHPKKM